MLIEPAEVRCAGLSALADRPPQAGPGLTPFDGDGDVAVHRAASRLGVDLETERAVDRHGHNRQPDESIFAALAVARANANLDCVTPTSRPSRGPPAPLMEM
jgi:hypothetical protein